MKRYKESILNPQDIRRTTQTNYFLIFVISACMVGIGACGKSRRPGLSDKELFALQEVDTLQSADASRQSQQKSDVSDKETYIVPPGIKYAESRAVDPANPPVVIDLANRNLNIKKFDLSDYYSHVWYYKLKHPLPASEGNFLFDVQTHNGRSSGRWSSNYYFTNDSIIAGDVFFGYYSYDLQGNYLNTVKTYHFDKHYDVANNLITYNEDDYKSAIEAAGSNQWFRFSYNHNNNLWLFMDKDSWVHYVYNQRNTPSNDFLFTFSTKGDTLCRFVDYNPKPDPNKKGQPIGWRYPHRMYFYEGKPTVQQARNDTVYRVAAPNRLVPAYLLNYGRHKLDMEFAEDFSDKFFPDIWRETDKYILITYNRNYYSKRNFENGSVQFFYAFYDKHSRQLYHFCDGIKIPEKEFLIDNTVSDGLPFILSYADILEHSICVYYSKNRLNDIIQNKDFPSLPPEQQKLLQDRYNDLEENEVLIMYLQ